MKVLTYGYLTNLYSNRKIEQALHQNIHFMWLSDMSYPDHNTINRFRSDRLKGILKEVFLDGTKIEAKANRYTFVWGHAIKKSKVRIKQQLKELWAFTEQVAQEELIGNRKSLSKTDPL